MIKGIGIDLVENNRIKKLYTKYGSRFAEKILSKTELIEFENSSEPIAYLAKHFASKEAFSKAVGTGLYRNGIYPSKISIGHLKTGQPYILDSKAIIEILKINSLKSVFISISDTKQHSVAVVAVQ
ncbi:MAG: holo-[acyl-carrier-protein] synthase [Gammaproteobacteria bacterium]|nr:holo-[acyl-carrier-protein] synthase [Gammaproteobacteria bacterium]|tara:strand:- start:1003 stop:1380 length:378 start_codon:yes stop_codon:yes gene_type:complete